MRSGSYLKVNIENEFGSVGRPFKLDIRDRFLMLLV
jgi:hypothetical protein